jgi:hypothetical protein
MITNKLIKIRSEFQSPRIRINRDFEIIGDAINLKSSIIAENFHKYHNVFIDSFFNDNIKISIPDLFAIEFIPNEILNSNNNNSEAFKFDPFFRFVPFSIRFDGNSF